MDRRLRKCDQFAADPRQCHSRAGADARRAVAIPSRVNMTDLIAIRAEQRLDRNAEFVAERERD